MRVVHLTKFHWELPGGIERYTKSCIEVLSSDSNIESIGVIYFQRSNFKASCDTDSKLTSIEIPTAFTLRSAPIPRRSSKISEKIRNLKADVIHFHHPNPTMHKALDSLLKNNPQAKLLIHYHSDIERQRILRILYAPIQNRLLRRADIIIATSPQYVNSSKILSQFKEKVRVIPFGINSNHFAFKQVFEDDPRTTLDILSVGRLVSYKGYETFIEAAAILKKDESLPPFKITIVGRGPLLKSLLAKARALKVSNILTIEANISDQELWMRYQKSDIFVLPSVSRAEAFGLSMLEAMAFGKPIVTTRLGTGTEFLVEHENNGIVVPPKDPDKLAQALRTLLTRPDLRALYGSNSKTRTTKHFSEQSHFDQLKSAYFS